MIADLHIHGRYSQATSKNISIETLEKYARLKGVDLLGTGDFTHPKWIKEIEGNLLDDGSGVLRTKNGFPFVLSTEISLVYTDGRGRRIHNVVLCPNIDTATQITEYLKTKGRVDYDGRPIFKIPCPEFVEKLQEINPKVEVIPAHIWTPWFSLFGSKSGFDNVKECFKDKTNKIHAMETGISSDPQMNWRLSQLDKFSMVSFSDLHSYWPWRLGREATIFEDGKVSYDKILKDIRNHNIKGTIEVEPAYGKYHFDGHRKCNVVMHPRDSLRHNKICPVCKKPLTIGVEARVEELADRDEGYARNDAPKVYKLLPLSELISKFYGVGLTTQKQWKMYNEFTKDKNEFEILLRTPYEQLAKIDKKMAEIIILNRQNNIKVRPGYDGVYGQAVLDM